MPNMLGLLTNLRFRHSDTSTAVGRDAERYRLAAFAVLSSLVSRALSLVLLVLGVHMTAGYLGSSRFGVWATFASMLGMLSFLDLGVGNALVNRVASAEALRSLPELRRTVTGGVGLLAVLGIAATVVLLILAWIMPWGSLFGLPNKLDVSEARYAGFVFAILFGPNLFVSGLSRILAGQQRSYEVHLISGCGTLLACMALWFASHRQASVPWLLLSTVGIQTLAGSATLLLFSIRGLFAPRAILGAIASERRNLLNSGSLFLVMQIGTMIGWGSDSIILASLRSASAVAVYAVAQRLFQFASQPFAVLNAPLWAAYADAYARRDLGFVRATFRRSIGISVTGAVCVSCFLLVVGPYLIPYWTHNAIIVPRMVLGLFATWTVLEVSGTAFAMYLNGCGIMRQQVAVICTFSVVVLPLKFYLGSMWGISGILLATIVSFAVVNALLYGILFRAQVLRPLMRTT